MSQYPGGQQPPPPNDPYYGQPQGSDPYGQQQGQDPYGQQQGQDPYYGAPPPGDPYAPPPDPYYNQQPGADPYAQRQQGQYQPGQDPYYGAPPPQDTRKSRGGSGAAIFGIILVIIGVWVLFGDQLDIDVDWSDIWPIIFVVVGAVMVLASLIPGRSDGDR